MKPEIIVCPKGYLFTERESSCYIIQEEDNEIYPFGILTEWNVYYQSHKESKRFIALFLDFYDAEFFTKAYIEHLEAKKKSILAAHVHRT